MKAANAFKAVMLCALAVTGLHFALQSATDRFVAGAGQHGSAPAAPPQRQVMVTQAPVAAPPAAFRDEGFGDPASDWGQPHPALPEAEAAPPPAIEPPSAPATPPSPAATTQVPQPAPAAPPPPAVLQVVR